MGMKNALKVVMLLLVFAVGCKPDEPNNGGDNNHLNGHEYVDLGLPSGTLWATCNVGADSPEDYGDYYAWGDTLPKTMYDWKSYPYATFVDGHYELTKYCMDSCCGFNGFVDYVTVLEPVDDAVTANWGTGWRMPTKEEWAELYQNTTFIWTSQNGIEGRLLTGSNGNSIFLPAAGFHIDSESCHTCGTFERCRGHAVRPVCSRVD